MTLDHEFVEESNSPYCAHWGDPHTSGSPEHGTITMQIQCGYPRDAHPTPDPAVTTWTAAMAEWDGKR